jgi:lipopolysaccharide transport system ATP-binding protein
MSSEIIVRVKNVSKSYKLYKHPTDRLKEILLLGRKRLHTEFHALKNLNFEVRRGESLGLVGSNGSGKSTLLQIICKTLKATSGSIETSGRICALLELGSGFNHDFTGAENIRLYAAILGMTPAEVDQRYQAILDFADIGEFIHQPLKVYSSGMIVRLAFSAAVHAQPDILVVDEALSVGDTAFQQKCLSKIRQLQASGVSIILVSHSGNTVIEYCDRAIYLKHGQQMMDGPCELVMKRYGEDIVEQERLSLSKSSNSASLEPAKAADHQNGIQDKLSMSIATVQFFNHQNQIVSTYDHGEKIRICVKINVLNDVAQPCSGIQLATVDGIVLWSATTQLLGQKITPWKAGQYELIWNLVANFGPERYVVSLGVGLLEKSDYLRIHRLDYAGYFDIAHQSNCGAGYLSPLSDVQVIPVT